MPRHLVLTAAILASTLPLFAQESVPSSGVTLTTGTQLVVVDVVVEDREGHPVHGLKASDFQLEERKKPQPIKTFDEHTAIDRSHTPAPPPLNLPPGTFTDFTPVPEDSTLNVLLLDALNTPMVDQAYVRNQLKEYVKHATPGTRIAIFGLTSHLVLLQGFTSDPEILKNIVEHKLIPHASNLLDDPLSGNSDPNTLSENMSALGANAGAVAGMQQFEADTASFQTQFRIDYTLQAFMQMARYLSGFPGRKNLIWFSGSFPLNIFPDPSLDNPFTPASDASGALRDTAGLLARGRIAVYPIDARGLQTAPMTDASVAGGKYVNSPTKYGTDLNNFHLANAQEHFAMDQVAEDTGGHAFYNNNGLAAAVTKALDAGANFYTLTYSPSDRNQHGEYRTIHLQLQGEAASHGLKLSYRHGYFTDDLAHPNRRSSSSILSANASAAPPPDPGAVYGRTAMQRGAPTPSEIMFKVRVLPDSKSTSDTVAPKNHLDPEKPIKGPFRLYNIDFAVLGGDLKFPPQPDGKRAGAIEFVTYVYDADGKLLNIAGESSQMQLTPEVYARLVKTGLGYNLKVSAPAKGESFLRIAVHDLSSNHYGVVEVPTSSVSHLDPAPLTVPAPPPAPSKK